MSLHSNKCFFFPLLVWNFREREQVLCDSGINAIQEKEFEACWVAHVLIVPCADRVFQTLLISSIAFLKVLASLEYIPSKQNFSFDS